MLVYIEIKRFDGSYGQLCGLSPELVKHLVDPATGEYVLTLLDGALRVRASLPVLSKSPPCVPETPSAHVPAEL
jgi:hypothetical protein